MKNKLDIIDFYKKEYQSNDINAFDPDESILELEREFNTKHKMNKNQLKPIKSQLNKNNNPLYNSWSNNKNKNVDGLDNYYRNKFLKEKEISLLFEKAVVTLQTNSYNIKDIIENNYFNKEDGKLINIIIILL